MIYLILAVTSSMLVSVIMRVSEKHKVSNLYVEAYERDETPMCCGAIDHLAVSTDDIEGAFEEAKRLGLTLANEQVDYSDYWPGTAPWFHIIGPNGERIEFTK